VLDAQAPAAGQHYWPHPRGRLGSLTQTQYGVPPTALKNLSAHLAWKWEPKINLTSFIWGCLIDRDRNVIIATQQGIYKYTPDGEPLWSRPDVVMGQMPVLMGDAIYTQAMMLAVMCAIDLHTGKTIWVSKPAWTTGMEGDMVEGHNGVLVAGVGWGGELNFKIGTPALRAIGVNASTGKQMWSYTPACGLWNIMALFPDEDSTIFMDRCGGLYRVNLFTGKEIWSVPNAKGGTTDGGSMLGPDGSVYSCSNEDDAKAPAGRLRKHKVVDGSLIWEAVLANECNNFPSVSPDGATVVLADGANTLDPVMKWVHDESPEVIEKAWGLQQALLKNKTQRQYYGRRDLSASILGYDARTGAMKWKHDVEPWYGMAFVLDDERAYLFDKGLHPFGHCGPPHWGGATIDQDGKVYIGRSDGELYIFDPSSDTETRFHTGDGALMGGVAFAPGLMVVPTCSWLYVFKY